MLCYFTGIRFVKNTVTFFKDNELHGIQSILEFSAVYWWNNVVVGTHEDGDGYVILLYRGFELFTVWDYITKAGPNLEQKFARLS